MHPEFAPIAFLAAFLLAIPLIWHWRSGNIAILSIVAWLFVTDMIYAVDAIVWAGNVDIRAPVWCISTKLIVRAKCGSCRLSSPLYQSRAGVLHTPSSRECIGRTPSAIFRRLLLFRPSNNLHGSLFHCSKPPLRHNRKLWL